MNEILVAVDLGPSSDDVLRVAGQLAKRLDARLQVVHVAAPDPEFVGYEAGPPSVRDAVAIDLTDEHRQVQEMVRALRARGVDAAGRLLRGPTVETIRAVAARMGADLIVVGRHTRRGLVELIVGSTSRELMRSAGRAVLVVPQRPHAPATTTT